MFNGCIRNDNSVGTLDLSDFVSHKFYLQAVAGADHVRRLRQMGFGATEKPGQRGQWEMAGAPADLLAAWSKSRARLLKQVAAIGYSLAHPREADRTANRDGARAEANTGVPPLSDRSGTRARREAKQLAAITGRRSKAALPDTAGLEAKDRTELAELGLTPNVVIRRMREAALTTAVPTEPAAEAGIAVLFERTSVATLRQLRTAIAEAAVPRGLSVAEIEAEIQRTLSSGLAKAIGTGPRGEPILSTDAAIATEHRMLTAARDGQGKGKLSASSVEKAMAEIEGEHRAGGKGRFAFTDEQTAFVRWFARGDQVVLGEGLAGAGKTTAMRAVVRAAHSQGLRTIGVAPTKSAAETLSREAGTSEYMAIQKLAMDIRGGRRQLTGADYILLDEAGMAALGDVATVVTAARQAGAQLALVGDERQFAPIGAGSPFTALGAVLGSSRLQEIRRQCIPWQLDASQRMAAGDSVAGLMAYAAEARWTMGQDSRDAIAKLRSDWTTDLDREPREGCHATRMVIAARHADVHAINAELRRVLVETGRLGAEEITVRTLHRDGRNGDVRDLPLRVGDQLVVWRNTPAHNLNNGDRITVTGFVPTAGSDANDVVLRWRNDKTGAETEAPLSTLVPPEGPDESNALPRVPFLQHAYAVTQYSAQGATVDRTFIYGGTGLDRRSTYVALTRHRDDAQIYWDSAGIADALCQEGQRPTRSAAVEHIIRQARQGAEKLNVIDYVRDVEAWLETGDVRAERALAATLAARIRAAEGNARSTLFAAVKKQGAARVVINAATCAPATLRSLPRPARVAPEQRARSAFAREIARRNSAAMAADRRDLAKFAGLLDGVRGRSGARRLGEGAPHTTPRNQLLADRGLDRSQQDYTRRRAEVLDAVRGQMDAPGRLWGMVTMAAPTRQLPVPPDREVWIEEWLRRARLGRHAPDSAILDPRPTGRAALLQRVAGLPEPLAVRLGDDALRALSAPALIARPDAGQPTSVATYAGELARERRIEEDRVVAGVARWSGKEEAEVRRTVAAALSRPREIEHGDLRLALRRLKALEDAERAVAAALAAGRVRADAPIAPVDPELSPHTWRVELQRASRASEVHSPGPSPDADRSAFDGSPVTVAELHTMLGARRAALGVPKGTPAPEGSAAALLDGAIGAIREEISEGRLSARGMIAATAPSDRQGWATALRAARQAHRRRAASSSPRSYEHGLSASLEWQAVEARAGDRRAAQPPFESKEHVTASTVQRTNLKTSRSAPPRAATHPSSGPEIG